MRVILLGKTPLILLLGALILLNLFIGNLAGESSIRHSGDSIDVMYGSAVEIDAVISKNEWSDANTIQRNIEGKTWTVYYKESGSNLYIAYDYPDENMADIFIDVNHNGGSAPKSDDLYFHSSLADWEKFGTGYEWCDDYIDPNGWEVAVDSDYLQREFRISYDKLGITPGEDKTLGICFGISITEIPGTKFFPSLGTYNSPNSWADMYSSFKWSEEQPVNNIPELTGNKLTPDSGFTYTEFTFSLIYTDSDNDAPEVSNVIIDDIPFEMNSTDTSYKLGCLFKYETTLDVGTHSYYFQFNDGKSEVRLPETGTLKTPYVQPPNSPPVLKNGEIPNQTFTIAEDSQQGDELINLEEYFMDDRDDGNLKFEVVHQEDIDKLEAIINGHYLEVEQKLENWFGNLEFQVKAMDRGINPQAVDGYELECISNKFTISVSPTPDAPIIEKIGDKDVVDGQAIEFSNLDAAIEDQWFEFTITASDADITMGDADELIFETNLSMMNIVPNPDEPRTAEVYFLPTNYMVGRLYCQIMVTDSYGEEAKADLQIEIKNSNDDPTIESVMQSNTMKQIDDHVVKFFRNDAAIEDEWFNISIICYDPDIEICENDELIFETNVTSPNFVVERNTGEISFLPEQHNVGKFYAHIILKDKYGEEIDDYLDIIITVKNKNDPPDAPVINPENGKYSYMEGDFVNLTCSGSDSDLPYDNKEHLTYSWKSDKDGVLGNKDSLSTNLLSIGTHHINLTLTDNYGAQSSSKVTIIIKPNDTSGETAPEERKNVVITGAFYSWLMIIIVVVIILLAVFYLFYRKKKKEKVKIRYLEKQPLVAQVPQVYQQIPPVQQPWQMAQFQIPTNQYYQFYYSQPQQSVPVRQYPQTTPEQYPYLQYKQAIPLKK